MGVPRSIVSRGVLVAALTATVAVALPACGSPETSGASSSITSSSTTTMAAEPASAPSASSATGSTSSSAAATASPSPAATTRCATAWGTAAKSTGTRMSGAEIYLVRAGRHPCFDRIVLDVNGTAPVDATVRYVSAVLSDPAGRPVPVSGRVSLQVVVRAPYLGAGSSGHQPYRKVPAVGSRLVPAATLAGLAVVRDVRFAGTFEGVTTVAVGVAARLPVRVFVTRDQSRSHVVVDIARR
jgi:hypothetical protein